MRYLTAADIVVIHDRIIEETGKGMLGIRDEHLLKSLVERPRASFGGAEQFATVFEKAAALFEAIATYHVFFDANKRTAIGAAAVFLRANGYKIKLSGQDVDELIVSSAQKRQSVTEIVSWLGERSDKYT